MELALQDFNLDDPQEITNYVVHEYYKDNFEPFFAFLHPDVLFLSVGKNQIVEGIDVLKAAYMKETLPQLCQAVQYDIVSFASKKQKVSRTICNILVEMQIRTKCETGAIQEVNQRITVNWCKYHKLQFAQEDVRSGWFALQIHVSIGLESSTTDNAIRHLAPGMAQVNEGFREEEDFCVIRDCNRFEHYVRLGQIIRIEAKKTRSYVYLQTGNVLCTRKKLQEFEEELGDRGFIRIHKSYIINRTFVEGLKNYKLKMTDGKIFPVPKGKFQNVKQKLGEKSRFIT